MTDQPRITCPICRMTSYNPTDIAEGYCGNCHDWTTPRMPFTRIEHDGPCTFVDGRCIQCFRLETGLL